MAGSQLLPLAESSKNWFIYGLLYGDGIQATTGLADKLAQKTVLGENWLDLCTGFEDTATLEDKKGLTVFPLNRSLTVY